MYGGLELTHNGTQYRLLGGVNTKLGLSEIGSDVQYTMLGYQVKVRCSVATS